MAGSVPVLHLEAQTVDEMLVGWRNQQLCADLDHGTIAGRWLMCSPRSNGATTDQQRTRLPHVSSRLTMPVPDSRVRLRRVHFQPGRVECPYQPAKAANLNMEGYR